MQFVGHEFLKGMLFKRFRSPIYIKVSKSDKLHSAFVDLTYLVCICCRRSRSALLETFGDLYIKAITKSGLCCILKNVASTSLVSIQGPNVKLDFEYMASP